MTYCTNCGNELNGESFCPQCGASVDVEPESYVPATNGQKKNSGVIGIIVGVVAVIAIIAVAIFFFGGRSEEKVVKDYVKATINADAKKILSSMPDSFVDYICEEEFDGDRKEMVSELQDYLNEVKEEFEEEGVKKSDISYEIVETEDMDKDDIKSLKKLYKKADMDIKEGKRVEVELTAKVDGEDETESIYLDLVKIGRSWYILEF